MNSIWTALFGEQYPVARRWGLRSLRQRQENYPEVKVMRLSSAETAHVLEALRSGKVIILMLNNLEVNAAQKVVDLMLSCIDAIHGQSQWLGEQTFLFAPGGFQVTVSQVSSIQRKIQPVKKPALCKPKESVLLKLPQTWLEELGSVCLEMVPLPSGTFMMGSPLTEAERSIDEGPQHSVAITAFAIGKYPITQAQWRAIAALPAIERPLDPRPACFKGDDLPVEQVSWYEAVEFCARLTQKTGRFYRLPSEAEWEYAARATTTTPFHFGEAIATDLANYDGCSRYGAGFPGQYRQQTTPVGTFGISNGFGLYDLHGNVWEWCGDFWHDNYFNAPSDGSAWISGSYQTRVIRGGSWYDQPRFCRSACRYALQPEGRSKDVGFRVVCDVSL